MTLEELEKENERLNSLVRSLYGRLGAQTLSIRREEEYKKQEMLIDGICKDYEKLYEAIMWYAKTDNGEMARIVLKSIE